MEADLRFLTATNNVFTSSGKVGEAQLHYVTVFMVGRCEEGAEPQVSTLACAREFQEVRPKYVLMIWIL